MNISSWDSDFNFNCQSSHEELIDIFQPPPISQLPQLPIKKPIKQPRPTKSPVLIKSTKASELLKERLVTKNIKKKSILKGLEIITDFDNATESFSSDTINCPAYSRNLFSGNTRGLFENLSECLPRPEITNGRNSFILELRKKYKHTGWVPEEKVAPNNVTVDQLRLIFPPLTNVKRY